MFRRKILVFALKFSQSVLVRRLVDVLLLFILKSVDDSPSV